MGVSSFCTRTDLRQRSSQRAGFLKIAVSVALLTLLLYSLDITRIVDSIGNVRWWTIVLAVALQLLLFSLANFRWWMLLNYHTRSYRPVTLLAPYFIGVFFNNILPTTLGGSLFRMYYIYQDNHSAVVAASPIITERLLGLVAMIATAAVIVPFLPHEAAYMRVLADTLTWLLASAFAALALIGSRPAYRVLQAALVRWCRFKLVATALRITEAIHIYLAHPRLVLEVFAISVGLQVMTAGVYYLIGTGLGATVALLDYLVIAPLVFIAATLPLSIGGLGVREAAAVSLFVAAGMSPGHAGALAFLYLVVLLLGSAPGLYMLFTTHDVRRLYWQARRQPIG
jgi:uncharacterized protein (TIRG00374 family)